MRCGCVTLFSHFLLIALAPLPFLPMLHFIDISCAFSQGNNKKNRIYSDSIQRNAQHCYSDIIRTFQYFFGIPETDWHRLVDFSRRWSGCVMCRAWSLLFLKPYFIGCYAFIFTSVNTVNNRAFVRWDSVDFAASNTLLLAFIDFLPAWSYRLTTRDALSLNARTAGEKPAE